MKIPLEILEIRDPNGTSSFKAIISLQDAIGESSQSQKLIQIQTEYTRLIYYWQKLLKEIGSNRECMADSRMQWRLADEIYSFIKWIESDGYVFANVSEALSRDLEVSKSRLKYLIRFRTYYPAIAQVFREINWSKYQEMLDIKDSETRRICENRILSGEIRTDHDIRAFKKRYREGKNPV
jgi:hypothetical protein